MLRLFCVHSCYFRWRVSVPPAILDARAARSRGHGSRRNHPGDVVLEPSAGTGLMAILAEIAGGRLVLNELADTRAELLSSLFPAVSTTRFDAAQIDDHLQPAIVPSVVLMN